MFHSQQRKARLSSRLFISLSVTLYTYILKIKYIYLYRIFMYVYIIYIYVYKILKYTESRQERHQGSKGKRILL